MLLFFAALLAGPLALSRFDLLYENLDFEGRLDSHTTFARVVENRNGVTGVTEESAVLSGG